MSRALSNRLHRIEASRLPPSKVVVIEGHSEDEHAATISAMRARGETSDRDLFVCLMRFAERGTP